MSHTWGIKKSIVVNAPVDQVFSYLADLSCHREWDDLPYEAHVPTSPGPVGLGSTYERRRYVGADVSDRLAWGTFNDYAVWRLKVTEFVPNERLAYEERKTGGGYDAYIFFAFRSSEHGTVITKGSGLLIPKWFVPLAPMLYLYWPLVYPFRIRQQTSHLRRIKSNVESRRALEPLN